jgi:reverse gyrase
MDKNCSNCYWEGYKDMFCIYEKEKPVEETCNKHSYMCIECDSEIASYKYKGKYYCQDCLLKQFNIEDYTVTHYMRDGEYLGSDEDIDQVINNLCEEIEEID